MASGGQAGAGEGAWIAVDWGTSSRRAFRLSAKAEVEAVLRDDRGVSRVPAGGFAAETARLRSALGDLPVLASGMIGSTRGWREAPYVVTPADAAAVAAAVLRVDERFAIVPGLKQVDPGREDVMRGEETLALGAAAAGLVPPDALVCQPGTHCKWIRMRGGRIVDFSTALTGELFALLREHSLLADMLRGKVADGPVFREGVRRGSGGGDLLDALFGVRAGVLLGARPASEAAAHASGLLIGADCGARALATAEEITLVADARLGVLYEAAIGILGGHVRRVDSETAFLAGIRRIRELSA